MKSISSGIAKLTKVDGETEQKYFGENNELDYVLNKKAGKKEEHKRKEKK